MEESINKKWKTLKKCGFEENKGQFEEKIKYVFKGQNNIVYFYVNKVIIEVISTKSSNKNREIINKYQNITFESDNIELEFEHCNIDAKLIGKEEAPGKINYINNNLPNGKVTKVNIYSKILYKNIYDKVDVEFYIKDNKLEYDFIVNKGGHSEDIRIKCSKDIAIYEDNIIIKLNNAEIKILKPVSYEVNEEMKKVVESKFVLKNNIIKIKNGYYNYKNKLIIDPIILFSTFLGGSNIDQGTGIKVDDEGNVFVTGFTVSEDFPRTNPAIGTIAENQYSVFVAKFDPLGALSFSTIVSGSSQDQGSQIEIDSDDNIYVGGITSSSDFPYTNILGESTIQLESVFVFKMNPEGTALIYCTVISGNNVDVCNDLVLDASNNTYLAGYTASSNYPTTASFGAPYNGSPAAFLTKVNSEGTNYDYSVYLNGSQITFGFGVAINSDNVAFLTGYSEFEEFPYTTIIGTTSAGDYSMFVAKINATGTALEYATLIGGSQTEAANGIVLASDGNPIVIGGSSSANFPIDTVIGSTPNNTAGINVLKLNEDGTELLISTLINGDATDVGEAITLDEDDNIYITGYTFSQNFPFTGAFGEPPNNSVATFIVSLQPDGKTINYIAYINASNLDVGLSIDEYNGTAYITGYSNSINFPLVNPYQDTSNGSITAIILALEDTPIVQTELDISKVITPVVGLIGSVLNIRIIVTNVSVTNAENVEITDQLPRELQYVTATISQGTIDYDRGAVIGRVGTLLGGAQVVANILVYPTALGTINNTAEVSTTTAESDDSNNMATDTVEIVSVYDLLTDPTYGLEEIKNEVRSIESSTVSNSGTLSGINDLLTNPAYGLNALENGINENINETRAVSSNISAINNELNIIENSLNNINDLSTGISSEVSNPTYGLAAIQSELNNIRSLLGSIECNCDTEGVSQLIINLQVTINNYYNNTTAQNQQLLNIINCNFQRLWERNCYFEEALKVINEKINYLIRRNI